MPVAPEPSEIFRRAVEEGQRRLDQSLLELVATSFIAGFTIIFGIVALGIVHALVGSQLGRIQALAGALAFGVGVVFLIVGRAELFTENFFDPVAKAVDEQDSWMLSKLGRLWVVTFSLNLVGGVLFALVFVVEGVLPHGTSEALVTIAEEIVRREAITSFAKAVAGGTLVTLLSFFLEAVNSVTSRIVMSYLVGVLLALGPFDHVVVTALHVVFGMLFGAPIGLGALATTVVVVTAGNAVGGLGLVTLTHVAQAKGASESKNSSGSNE